MWKEALYITYRQSDLIQEKVELVKWPPGI